MIVSISLAEDSVPFWFLGEPRNIKKTLNFSEPGPVQVDFTQLTKLEQKKILTDLAGEVIECDRSFNDLRQVHLHMFPEESPDNQKAPDIPVAEAPEPKKEVDQRAKLEERCALISKQGVRAIKAVLKDEKDTTLLRLIRRAEGLRKKPRASVISFLDSLLVKLSLEKAEQIEASIENDDTPLPRMPSTSRGETINYDVVESERETVALTAEQLNQFALGEPLGGD